jgi:glyoxylase-like metal-dependent hydrolase (beta-lactamase superfamily II)
MSSARFQRGLLVFSIAAAAVPIHANVKANYGTVADTFTTEKVADGVYAFLAPDSKTPFVSGNSLAIVGKNGVLVVDSGHVPSLTRRMIGEIKKVTGTPVRFVVNTHWHFDHLMGNAEYVTAFPEVAIVSTEATAERIRAEVPPYAERLRNQIGPALESIRQSLKDGSKRDGTPLTPDDRDFLTAELHDFQAAAPALAEMRYAPPTMTFDRDLTIDLGGREVRVLFLGRGNTAGDAVVYVPDAKVVATGDLVVAPVPYATQSFIFDWIATMKKLTALEAAVVIPGHGPLMHDWSYASRVSDLLQSVAKQASAAVAGGVDLEHFRKQIDVGAFRDELAGDDPFQMRIFDTYFMPGAVERAYKEAAFQAEK